MGMGRSWNEAQNIEDATDSQDDEKTSLSVVFVQEGLWFFYDEVWASHGPYDTRQDALEAVRLYDLYFVRGDVEPKHVTEATWRAKVEAERPDAIHPCDDWRAWACMCIGACSCHFVQDQEKDPF